LVTLSVPVLDGALNEIADRGLPIPEIEVIGDAGRKASFVDPEGNTIALVEIVEAG
jgi:predicted enzyme related to lactoylglutathione lyase